jgi:hypothetical protein
MIGVECAREAPIWRCLAARPGASPAVRGSLHSCAQPMAARPCSHGLHSQIESPMAVQHRRAQSTLHCNWQCKICWLCTTVHWLCKPSKSGPYTAVRSRAEPCGANGCVTALHSHRLCPACLPMAAQLHRPTEESTMTETVLPRSSITPIPDVTGDPRDAYEGEAWARPGRTAVNRSLRSCACLPYVVRSQDPIMPNLAFR